MNSSQNVWYLFGGRYSKDYNMFASIMGFPYLWKSLSTYAVLIAVHELPSNHQACDRMHNASQHQSDHN